MTIRKMTAEDRSQLFGDGLALPGKKQKKQKKLSSNAEYDDGFSATLMDGPHVDLFGIAGLEWTPELNDALWGKHNWKSLLESCEAVEITETGRQDDAPGMSDVFFWVAINDPKKFKCELREAMLAANKF